MKGTITPTTFRRRLSLSAKSWIAAAAMAVTALVLLSIHVFTPISGLQAAGLGTLGFSLFAAWIAVLSWRMPVLDRGPIVLFGLLWIAGLTLSIACVQQSSAMQLEAIRRSAQWLALTLSLAVGALFLRALLRRRTTSRTARLLSLLSPLVILLLILFSSPHP